MEPSLFRAFIIAESSENIMELSSELTRNGLSCQVTAEENEVLEKVSEQAPDLLLVEMNGNARIRELPRLIKQERNMPIMALLHRDGLGKIDAYTAIDDFVIQPYDAAEISFRAKRLLHKNGNSVSSEVIRCGNLMIDTAKCEVSVDGNSVSSEVIRCGNLMIDTAKCEVSVDGNPAQLTFREYELLKFMSSNPERVFTRDTLLDKVWGYDYLGGDRTVDVHIRRLRSKLGGLEDTFIETVRNIGYRFRKHI